MTTRNIVLQFTNYDFNPTDMAFIARHVGPQFDASFKELVESLTGWFTQRSYGPEADVYYDLRSSVEDNATRSLSITGGIALNGEDVLNLDVKKVHVNDMPEGEELLEHAIVMDKIDEAFAYHNQVTDNRHKHILYSLRPLLRGIYWKCNAVYVNKTGPVSVIEFRYRAADSDYYNTIELQLFGGFIDHTPLPGDASVEQ